MVLEFHSAARDEFLAVAEYYKTAVPGLGGRFLGPVTRAPDIVLQHPAVGERRGARARQLIVTGFPYDVVYIVHDDVVSILAVAHHHRRPGYWRERLNGWIIVPGNLKRFKNQRFPYFPPAHQSMLIVIWLLFGLISAVVATVPEVSKYRMCRI